MTCLGASAGQPWSSSQPKSHRLGLTTASASSREARWATSSPKRATVSGTFCAASAKTLAGPWQYTTNAVRDNDMPSWRDRRRRVRKCTPVVCNDHVRWFTPQGLVDMPGRREERRSHGTARRQRTQPHLRLGIGSLPIGAQPIDVSTRCDEKLDLVPAARESNGEERVRCPGPTRARDAEDLAGDDGDPSRRHRPRPGTSRRNERRATSDAPSSLSTLPLERKTAGAAVDKGRCSSAASRVPSSAVSRRLRGSCSFHEVQHAPASPASVAKRSRAGRTSHQRDRNRDDLGSFRAQSRSNGQSESVASSAP